MSDLLSLGLSGLTAYRSALAAVGENVANAETPGFARRTVRLEAGNSGTSADPLSRDSVVFGGVRAEAVVRAWDMFRAAEARHAAAADGRGSVREQWLTAMETALDDSAAGVGARITAFFNAADTLAAAPADTLNRSRLLLALEEAAGAFRNTGGSLSRISTAIGEAATLDVTKTNQSLAALADVNRTLKGTPAGGTTRAALEDERDRLIDVIAGSIDVLTTTGDDGTATVRLADAPGTVILGNGTTGQFGITAAADGRLSLQLTAAGATIAFTPATGRFAGYVEASTTTANRRAALDTLAADFSASINAWSAAGRDASGTAGPPLLDAAADATTMRALIEDPARIAAASADGRTNGNLLALGALRGDGGVEQRWTGIVAGHAQLLAAAKSEAAAVSAWRDNAFAALDETTGIDLDREAADLLRFQQAYSAATRIIQVGREIFDDLLNAV